MIKETYMDGHHLSALHSLQELSFHVITKPACLTIAYLPVQSLSTRQSQCKLLEQKPSIGVWRYLFSISAGYQMF